MAAEKITIYIDPAQIKAQKQNNYSLYLAKKVNGVFTVIWQSKGPVATVNNPSYEYKNEFDITIPNYNVNFGNVAVVDGAVTFTSGGKNTSVEVGQTVNLDVNGLFSVPKNDGKPGIITIHNSLAANPHEILSDASGNVLFVNVASGMDIGDADLTPIDTYQIWFDSYQDTGTIIAHNVSTPATVVFDGGTIEKTISYSASGQWQDGPPASKLFIGADQDHVAALQAGADAGEGVAVIVAATFTTALTIAAATYLLNKLIGKFSGGLRPSEVQTSVGSFSATLKFQRAQSAIALLGLDAYETAVDNALKAAAADSTSGLGGERWTLAEPQISVTYPA